MADTLTCDSRKSISVTTNINNISATEVAPWVQSVNLYLSSLFNLSANIVTDPYMIIYTALV